MKKVGLLVFILIIFISFVSALSSQLISPPNNIFRDTKDPIQFTCNVRGNDLLSIDFFTNTNGSWKQIDRRLISGTEATGSFTLSSRNLANGAYLWNCKVVDAQEGSVFAPQNFTFTLAVPSNDPPVCNSTFPSVTLEKNTAKTNVINLSLYITDKENNPLTFDASGDHNVDITFKNNGFIDITPKPDKVATDEIRFKVNDGVNSDVQCVNTMTVNIISTQVNNTPVDTGPVISAMPDQTKDKQVNFWEIDLDDYVNDPNHAKEVLSWTVEGFDTSTVEITINSASHKAKFEPQDDGETIATFIVKDPDGKKDEEEVLIKITPLSTTNDDSESSNGDVSSEILKIINHAPGSRVFITEVGEKVSFSFETNVDKFDASWSVDENTVDEKSKNFTYIFDKEGKHKVTLSVFGDDGNDDYEWTVDVIPKVIEDVIEVGEEEKQVENIVEEENLCEDIECGEGEECVNGECVRKEAEGIITGFSIANIPKGNIVTGVVIVLGLILVISILGIRAKNKKKTKEKNLTSFGNIEKKVDKVIVKKEENTPAGYEHVIGFIQSGLASGDSEKNIKKALVRGGWNRKQIKMAFKSLKK